MEKKNLIASTYRELVIKNKSLKITVKELCLSTNISRTTFYKYFKDCNEIIEYTLLEDAINPTYELLCNDQIDDSIVALNWYLCFYKNKEFYKIAMLGDGQNSLFDTIIHHLYINNIILYTRRSPESSKTDIEYYAYKNATTQAMLLRKWINEDMCVSIAKMAQYFMKDLY